MMYSGLDEIINSKCSIEEKKDRFCDYINRLDPEEKEGVRKYLENIKNIEDVKLLLEMKLMEPAPIQNV